MASMYGSVPGDLNSAMNRLFHEKVQIKQREAKGYRDIAFSNVDKIIAYVNERDERFSREPVRAGSYWQGLRVGKADEYDYSILLEGIGDLVWGSKDTKPKRYGFNRPISTDLDTMPEDLDVINYGTTTLNRSSVAGCSQFPQEATTGYNFLNLTSVKWDDLMRDNDVVPFLVRKRLKQLLTEAKRNLNLRGEIRQSRKINTPAITMHFKAGEKEISIDFAPMIRARIPFDSRFGWPRNDARWPSPSKIAEIQALGVNLIAKKDFWWMYVFVDAEKELVKGIEDDGTKRKETHRLMKLINKEIWSPTTKPAITSYILKNIWYWAMEKHPDPRDWTTDHISTRVMEMTRHVLKEIEDRNIEQYFQPRFNLLQSKDPRELDIAADKIRKFIDNPMGKIIQLL